MIDQQVERLSFFAEKHIKHATHMLTDKLRLRCCLFAPCCNYICCCAVGALFDVADLQRHLQLPVDDPADIMDTYRNIDDKRAAVMLQNSEAKSYKYSLKTIADFKARIIENSAEGLVLEIDNQEIHFRLLGDFNAYNLLAVYATATLLGEDKNEVLLKLSNLSPVEGRFDTVKSNNLDIMGIVDYAHTPDALEKILATLQKLRKAENKIITIVGCGGDRDRTKRPLMAKIACEYSDQVILTSDNPRTEKPEGILMEMENGIPASFKMKTLTISDRKQAIKTACKLAKKEDIILVAGKGHEKYQEIMGTKYPFDDKIELKQAFEDQQL
jgi:UDP-N-acetylmuramoyl-L-alanyl-D-glutamate--2,6-diaminopimelate ligase